MDISARPIADHLLLAAGERGAGHRCDARRASGTARRRARASRPGTAAAGAPSSRFSSTVSDGKQPAPFRHQAMPRRDDLVRGAVPDRLRRRIRPCVAPQRSAPAMLEQAWSCRRRWRRSPRRSRLVDATSIELEQRLEVTVAQASQRRAPAQQRLSARPEFPCRSPRTAGRHDHRRGDRLRDQIRRHGRQRAGRRPRPAHARCARSR